MKKLSSGRSMVEMVGVLAIVGILSVTALVGYVKTVEKIRINKSVDFITHTIQNYANIVAKNLKGVNVSNAEAVKKAVSMKLLTNCMETDSMVEEGYKACKIPVGEVYVKLKDVDGEKYSFLLFATLNSIDLCIPFLSQNWDKTFPKDWWNNAAVWVASDKFQDGNMLYRDGTKPSQSVTAIETVCSATCPIGSSYCSVVFDIGGKL